MIVCPVCNSMPQTEFADEILTCDCERLRVYLDTNPQIWGFKFSESDCLVKEGDELRVEGDELRLNVTTRLVSKEDVEGVVEKAVRAAMVRDVMET